jgi:hypothetical protein
LNDVTPVPRLSIVPANSAAGENGGSGLNWYLPAMISGVEKIQRRRMDFYDCLAGPA